MSLKRKKKIIICFISVIILFIIIFCIKKIVINHKVITYIEYCKDIAREYDTLDLKQFQCDSIDKYSGSPIYFSFKLKDIDKYNDNEDECIYDIAVVKKVIEEYLKNNPNNNLCNEKIVFSFETYPGNISYMYNYDYQSSNSKLVSLDFMYYKKIYVKNISSLKILKNAKVIDLTATNLDDYSFLKNWTELKEINIFSPSITKQDKNNIKNILPNCNVLYDNEQ